VSIFILDSNIVSFYLRQNQQIIQKVHDEIAADNTIQLSPIAYYEVRRGLMAIQAARRFKEFTVLCDVLGVGQLDNTLLDVAAGIYVELKNQKQTIEDADILTAAFCKAHGFTLVTHNTRHFERISGLHYCDWI
jgi:tRNA(fMet)-specific endonuclease VapC